MDNLSESGTKIIENSGFVMFCLSDDLIVSTKAINKEWM